MVCYGAVFLVRGSSTPPPCLMTCQENSRDSADSRTHGCDLCQNMQRKISRGKRHMGQSPEGDTSFQSLPVDSHRMHLILLVTVTLTTHKKFQSTREAPQRLSTQSFHWRLVTQLFFASTNAWKESRCSIRTMSFVQTVRSSEPFLSGNGVNPSRAKFAEDSQWPTL